MQQFEGGEVFTNVAPGKTVTADRLNNHINGAAATNGLVIDQAALARPIAETDWILVGDNTQADALPPAKVTVANLLPEGMRNGSKNYALGSSANPAVSYAVTLAPAATAYAAGMVVRFRADHICAAGPTINVNTVGAVALLKYGAVALLAGDIVVGQIVEAVYDGVTSSFIITSPTTPTITPSAVQAASRNLVAQNNTGTPTTKVDIAADAIQLLDASNNSYVARSFSTTVNIGVNGANGLDTGSAANSTWYYFHAIYDATTNTQAGLLSTSASAPTLPAGYTFSALLGAVYNTGAGTLQVFYQQDRRVALIETTIFTAKASAANATYELYQVGAGGSDVDLRTIIPPIAKRLSGFSGTSQGGMFVAASSTGMGASFGWGQPVGSTFDNYTWSTPYDIPLVTAQTFYWKTLTTAGSCRLAVSGYAI